MSAANKQALARFASAGLLLGGAEGVFVAVRDYSMFLGYVELLRFALVAVLLSTALATCSALLVEPYTADCEAA